MMVSETDLIGSICRTSFYDFVKEFWHTVVPEKPVWNWHIQYICDEMQKLAERVFEGLAKDHDTVINISPGTSKSSVCSILFPPWTWTRMPTARHICGSYSYPLALDLSRKSRDVVASEKYHACFPKIVLREDQNTKGYFANSYGGTRYAVGVNGSVMGMHAHFIIIDDPLDPNQAVSSADLRAANHWLRETLPTRKVDKAVTPTVLIMQRLHQDDPTSLFLKRKHKIYHICLPAELSTKVRPVELMKRYTNGLMDPVRLSREVLDEARRDLLEYGYAAQFRQDPVPLGGGMFKTGCLRYAVPPPKMARKCRFWDKAGTQGGGAYTVGILMGVDESGITWILDVLREQLDSYEREMLIRSTAEKDGYSTIVGLEQSGGEGGKESAEMTVRRLAGFRVRVWKVGKSDGDKVERARPFSSQVNGRSVYLRANAPWIEDYVDELRYFPFSKYKDQVDASSGAFHFLHRRRRKVGGLF
jgi:predicted phage terminase large subunit-like protein